MGFLLSVKGGRAPAYVHDDVDSALVEAIRLQKSLAGQNNHSPEIQILQQVLVLPHRNKGQVLDYSAIQIKDYTVKIRLGVVLQLVAQSHNPL